jgi:quercetin dioxygenase-like cupin family protein
MEEKRLFWLDSDGGDSIGFLDQVYRVKAAGAQTGGLFGLVEVSTPQGSGPPPHVHEREDEAFYVLEGSYEVTVGNDRFDAREGCFIFAPRGVPHGYVVRAAPARHLGFVFPSGWGDVLPRRGPGDGHSGSGSSHARGVGKAARRHVARPAAYSVSAVSPAAPTQVPASMFAQSVFLTFD